MRVTRLLVVIASVAASVPASADEPFAEPLVTLSFDDGWATQYTHAAPLLRAHDMQAVFFLTTQALAEGWEGFMTLEQVSELQREGHELQSHTVNHPDLRSLDRTALDVQISESQAWLNDTFGAQTARHFAVPYGFYDDSVVDAVRRRYASSRTVLNGRNWRDGDVFALHAYDVHSRVTLADVRGWLEEARVERSWIILTFHELVDRAPRRGTELRTSDFEAIVEMVAELGLRVVGMDEAVALMTGDPVPLVPPRPPRAAPPTTASEPRDTGGCATTQPDILGLVVLGLVFLWRRRALALLLLVSCGAEPRDLPGGSRLTPAGTPGPPALEPGEPGLTFIGRFDWQEAERPIAAWPGTRILANFEGTQATVMLEEILLPWQTSGPSEMDVAIDGNWRDKLVLTPGPQTYVLAEGLAAGTHQIELYRRSEAQNGVTRFAGFEFPGGRLLPPPVRRDRRLEIIGDSASSGFGVEGVGLGPNCPGPDWGARYQNFRRAWGARLGERLSADVHGTIYSGKGIVRNIYRPDPVTMPRIYARANPLDPNSSYPMGEFVPDAIVVMLGGNDFMIGLPSDDGPMAVDVFAAALDAFLGELRATYPSTRVLLVLSPSTPETAGDRTVRGPLRDGLQAVERMRHEAGDAQVHLVEPPVAQPHELAGCNGHGTPEFHDRLAADLEPTVREITGW